MFKHSFHAHYQLIKLIKNDYNRGQLLTTVLLSVSAWADAVDCFDKRWRSFHINWANASIPVLLVRYEDLKTDLKGQLQHIAEFLKLDIPPDRIENVLNNSEGSYHRSHSKDSVLDKYTLEMQIAINETIRSVETQFAISFNDNGRSLNSVS